MIINKNISIGQAADRSKSIAERLLSVRGLTLEDINLPYDHIPSPYLINDMEFAVMRVIEALKNNENILIFGDFDGDGITATTVMMRALKDLGGNVEYFIPERLVDGYGINMESCKKFVKEKKYSLIITVDCGITAIDEIEYLMSNNIDVIVTDHHKTKDTLPNCIAVIDNQRTDNTYPFKEICGAMMAYKFVAAIMEELGRKGDEKKYIIPAMIGTITDVMPLVKENRAIVKEGLKALQASDSLNYNCLLSTAGKTKDTITAQDIAFYVGPLINASSRVGDVQDALNVFLSDDEDVVRESAKKLKTYNEYRKSIEKDITNEAMRMAVNQVCDTNPIVVAGDGWHKGVIGIVASRLVDRFFRPSIVLSLVDGIYTGSCRSYGDINIMDMLNYASEYIAGFGGHAGAAGLSIEEKNLDKFISKVNEYANKNIALEKLEPEKHIDLEIASKEISLDSFEDIKELEPFGEANREPLFICKNLRIKNIKKIGKQDPQEHIAIEFEDVKSNKFIKAVGFFMAEYYDALYPGDIVSPVFKLNKNEFMGRTSIQLMIDDLLFNTDVEGAFSVNLFNDYNNNKETDIKKICDKFGKKEDGYIPLNEDYVNVYKSIFRLISRDKYRVISVSLNFLSKVISNDLNKDINPFKLCLILQGLVEANILNIAHTTLNNICICTARGENIKISETPSYKRLANRFKG